MSREQFVDTSVLTGVGAATQRHLGARSHLFLGDPGKGVLVDHADVRLGLEGSGRLPSVVGSFVPLIKVVMCHVGYDISVAVLDMRRGIVGLAESVSDILCTA